jgi:hypothetical protein
MRYLSLSVLALAFAVGGISAASACEWMKTAKTQSTVASADQGSPQSTKIEVPAPKSGS